MSDRMIVAITIESIQDGETTVQTLQGEWFRKERSIYIRYEECMDAGLEASQIRTLIRYRPNELSITRRGAIESEQLFVQGDVRRVGYYRSAYTSFQLETDTHELVFRRRMAGELAEGQSVEPPFTIECQYELWVNEQMSGRFHIRFHIEPSAA